MAWCDAIAALWAFLIVFAYMTVSGWHPGAADFFVSGDGGKLLFILVTPLWAILRTLDFIGGGPARRRRGSRAPRLEILPPIVSVRLMRDVRGRFTVRR
jgi:hypothetical protein